LSIPKSEILAARIDRVLRRRAKHSNVELAVSLGVNESYVRKLRGNWRPARVREDLWRRLEALDEAGSPGAVREESPPYGALEDREAQFLAGALWAIEQGALGIAKTAAEARDRIAPRRPEGQL